MRVRAFAQVAAAAAVLTFGGIAMAAEADHETKGVTENNLPVFYQKLKDQLHFALAWDQAGGDFPRWRAEARAKFWDLLIQPDDATPFDAQVVEEQDRGGYVARKVVLSITRNSRIAALLLVPKGQGPFPAALVLHDHGGRFDIGKEKMVEPWGDEARLASAKAWVDKYYSGRFIGDDLARRGYVVLATDALGWGDRQNNGPDSQQALASNLFNLGSSLAGTIAVEDVRAARYLAALPEVDKDRVAVIGFSMGAFRAWQVAALTDTVTAGVAVNWMATLDGLMVPGNNQLKGQSAFNMLHPGMFRWFDYPDAAAIAAPKPMLFYAGETDHLFPVASVRQAFAKMEKVWADAGAPERFAAKVWPNAHIFRAEAQAEAFDWLDRQFGRQE
ncbi:dienelactone hydrolase family protein [Inquilinus limosus]|uniref:dienelactone hydrolase family protein n=1 Tax=Inquilinus limosus TaxID=171674 RepID=UPI000685D7C4|nr:alpha/beta fold hydrolase [Inquilinus limosus]